MSQYYLMKQTKIDRSHLQLFCLDMNMCIILNISIEPVIYVVYNKTI